MGEPSGLVCGGRAELGDLLLGEPPKILDLAIDCTPPSLLQAPSRFGDIPEVEQNFRLCEQRADVVIVMVLAQKLPSVAGKCEGPFPVSVTSERQQSMKRCRDCTLLLAVRSAAHDLVECLNARRCGFEVRRIEHSRRLEHATEKDVHRIADLVEQSAALTQVTQPLLRAIELGQQRTAQISVSVRCRPGHRV